MRIYQETLVETTTVTRVICNFCGEQIRQNDFGYWEEHLSFNKTWGYGSPHDGETHSVDICLSCYQMLVEKMKIPPEKCSLENRLP